MIYLSLMVIFTLGALMLAILSSSLKVAIILLLVSGILWVVTHQLSYKESISTRWKNFVEEDPDSIYEDLEEDDFTRDYGADYYEEEKTESEEFFSNMEQAEFLRKLESHL